MFDRELEPGLLSMTVLFDGLLSSDRLARDISAITRVIMILCDRQTGTMNADESRDEAKGPCGGSTRQRRWAFNAGNHEWAGPLRIYRGPKSIFSHICHFSVYSYTVGEVLPPVSSNKPIFEKGYCAFIIYRAYYI